MYKLYHGDCLDVMQTLPDKSIDMIFADLPYGTTQNVFDKQIPLEEYVIVNGKNLTRNDYLLWAFKNGVPYRTALASFREQALPGLWTHYKRIIKDNGCIALYTQTPFDVDIGNSNRSWLRYEWIIGKTRPTGHLNAKKAPMKAHEKILIFYKKPPKYHPQMTEGHPPAHSWTQEATGKTLYKQVAGASGGGSTSRYPIDILTFKWDTRTSALHPNQKPIAACEYFIRTYTDPGDIVLDNCMGSCSTGVACIRTDRDFIGIEKNESIFLDAVNRMDEEQQFKKEGAVSYVEGHQTVIQSVIEGF